MSPFALSHLVSLLMMNSSMTTCPCWQNRRTAPPDFEQDEEEICGITVTETEHRVSTACQQREIQHVWSHGGQRNKDFPFVIS